MAFVPADELASVSLASLLVASAVPPDVEDDLNANGIFVRRNAHGLVVAIQSLAGSLVEFTPDAFDSHVPDTVHPGAAIAREGDDELPLGLKALAALYKFRPPEQR